MYLIQLLLPASRELANQFAETRAELAEQFGGVTAYVRAPADGLWKSPDGEPARDDVVMVEVVVEQFDRAWWRSYTETLKRRFEQEAIHVRAIRVEMLDDEGV
jgi:hypothetical protein